MPSHLTRVVFRSFVANKPLLYRGCLQRSTRPRIVPHHGTRAPLPSQRRTFFDLFKPQRKQKSPEFPPGLEKMMELASRLQKDVRPPPPSEVAEAFLAFLFNKKRFEDYDMQLAIISFKYLQEHSKEDAPPLFPTSAILKVIRKLRGGTDTGGEPHLAFAKLLYEEVVNRQKAGGPEAAQKQSASVISLNPSDLLAYLRLLCLYGASSEGRDIATTSFTKVADPETTNQHIETVTSAWTHVLGGFARENNTEELHQTIEMMRSLSVPFTQRMQYVLVNFFASKEDLERAKHWYSQSVSNVQGSQCVRPSGETYAAILKCCALAGDLSFGQEVVAALLKTMPNKAAWDAIFVWSAAIGKGVEEVDRMMNVMVRRGDELRQQKPSTETPRPDIDTINALVEFCMSKQDSYSAERYISLGEKRGIFPNATTFIFQVQYRLAAKDIDGARAAYFGLEGPKDEKSAKAANKLVRAMCESKQHHFDDVMAIVDDLHEHKAYVEPETVATLCLLHLRRGEMHDAIDLLQVHAFHYSPPQRAIIVEQMVEFILDRQTSTAEVWDAYQTMRNIFPETSRNVRIRIMNEFFARKRSDMACHVFFHMRNHTQENVTANREVYLAAFTGFARNADAESLELAHNQLRLDLNVELDTQLRNSLMLAYAATGNNQRALEFWADIAASKEGPTYNSIAIAFRSCEGMPWGDQSAKAIWRRLKQMDMDIDKQIWTAYLGAIARNQLHDEAVTMLETVEEEYGWKPDLFILGTWFNTTTNIERQRRVQAWIREHYPEVWTEMEQLGYTVTMDGFGYRLYNLNRDLDP